MYTCWEYIHLFGTCPVFGTSPCVWNMLTCLEHVHVFRTCPRVWNVSTCLGHVHLFGTWPRVGKIFMCWKHVHVFRALPHVWRMFGTCSRFGACLVLLNVFGAPHRCRDQTIASPPPWDHQGGEGLLRREILGLLKGWTELMK